MPYLGVAPMLIARLKYAVVLLVLVCNAEAFAGVLLTPPDLLPGQQFRLAFVTSGSRDALSSNIEDYNTFVTNQAALNSALNSITTWKAIGSTLTIAARDNTGTNPATIGVPVYRLDGVRIANNYADLWDGFLFERLQIDEMGTPKDTAVWTGTMVDGTRDTAFNLQLGSSDAVATGFSGALGGAWLFNSYDRNPGTPNSLYAISSVLTVQTQAVPEPSTFVSCGLMLALSMFIRSRRKGVSAV